MVGVKRSAGCSLCVKRRVKCDEKRPGCGNCSKYGVPCPGFQRPLKFLGAKHGQSPGPHHIHASATPRPWNEAAAGGLDGSARDPAVDAATNSSPNRPRSRASPVNILPSHLRPSRDYELAPLAQSLWHADNAEDFFHFNAWFSSIADRLGSKVTLDTAVCAFALQVQGTTHGDELLCARARTVYVKALSSLQQALYHRLEWKSSETLCSAMLLCLYEVSFSPEVVIFLGCTDELSLSPI